ncbi:uncharacterized protein LOC141638682 isoform X2 [Silene latifolia]|uniref:uncharacterized protein LOC141638682 isoform X2 n=1 Tax=Silene latifolia TaxID=37657 RepID=UPI003D779738
MDQQIRQKRRVSFSDIAQGRNEEYTRLRNVTKSESFRDERDIKLRRDYLINGKESEEYAASIAAAAYAIYSLEETRAEFERRMVESFREDPSSITNTNQDQENPIDLPVPQFGGLSRRSSIIERNDVGGGPIPRSSTRPIEISGPRERVSPPTTMETNKADAWEKARLAKINKWYEKMNTKIKEWEKEKKKRASLDMERRKAEIERLKRLNLSHYQNKIDRIEDIAGGAKKQLQEKKRKEERFAKQKARKIRTTGRVPVQCFCFEY